MTGPETVDAETGTAIGTVTVTVIVIVIVIVIVVTEIASEIVNMAETGIDAIEVEIVSETANAPAVTDPSRMPTRSVRKPGV